MDQIGRIVETINRLLKKFEVSHVQRVEEELSLEDKISLFYLINDEAKETLEFLQNRIREDIITEWCRELDEKKQREWKLRVFESLDLMQNYKALKCLGYNKTNLSEVRSLLQHAVTSVEFDVRKALYSTVDTLTLDQLDKVIRHIDPGIQSYLVLVGFHYCIHSLHNDLNIPFIHDVSISHYQQIPLRSFTSITNSLK